MQIIEKRPEIKMFGIPEWCHHHCGKIQPSSTQTDGIDCVFESSATRIEIKRIRINECSCWSVFYEIKQAQAEWFRGMIIFSAERLRGAFGLSDESGPGGDMLIDKYGGDAAAQGYFIRYQNYLSIPGPGTGHDGDPNISVELTDEIKNAVAALLLTKSVSN